MTPALVSQDALLHMQIVENQYTLVITKLKKIAFGSKGC